MSAELLEVKSSLSQSQQKEKQSASLVQELTAMVKEQKTRITEILKAKKETAIEFKVRPNILLKKKKNKFLILLFFIEINIIIMYAYMSRNVARCSFFIIEWPHKLHYALFLHVRPVCSHWNPG